MDRLVVFFIPAERHINGGILSIFSLCKESRRFSSIHHAEVLLSVPPGKPSYHHNDLFENDETIYSFAEIIKQHPNPESLTLHIPEYMVNSMRAALENYKEYLSNIPHLHINVLDQNIELMAEPADIVALFEFTPHVTQTTAHLQYTTQVMADKYGIPLHLLSVSIDPSQYKRLDYSAKKDIIVYSPDDHPMKHKIIAKLTKDLPSYTFVEVKDMSYSHYKDLVASAKFTITFGEGFDGYLIETIFSGGIAFAVYNDKFFPSETYKKLPNIYADYDAMLSHIVSDIKTLKAHPYSTLNDRNHRELAKIYNYKNYIKNIEKFYDSKYTFTPAPDRPLKILLQRVAETTKLINEQQQTIEDQQQHISQQDLQIKDQTERLQSLSTELSNKERQLQGLVNSLSWRVTRPLRTIHNRLGKH